MSKGKPLVKLVDVGKAYSIAGIEIQILSEVNLEVRTGEFMSILGSYGSGRTCLMNIIGLISEPTSGRAFICGREITEISQRSLETLRSGEVGFLSRAFGLIPNLTVLENLELAFHINGTGDFEEKVTEALSDVGMEGGEYRLARTLSTLESRLLSVAKNMAAGVKLLVCDDPSAGLEEDDAEEMARLLIKANREREISVVLGAPEKLTDFDIGKTVWIEDGSVVGESRSEKQGT